MTLAVLIISIILIVGAICVWRFSLSVYEDDTSKWFIYCGIVVFIVGYVLMEVYFRFLS